MRRPVRNKYHRSLFLSALFALALAASVTAGCAKKPAEQPTVPAESSAADMNKIISDIAQDPEFKEAVSKAASNAYTDPALRKAVSEAAEDPEVSRAVSEAVSEALSEAIQEGLSKAVPDDPAVRAAAEAIAKSQGQTVPSGDTAAETQTQSQPTSAADNSLTDAEALASALQHAGVDAGSITDLTLRQDHEDGKQIFQIGFRAGQKQYEYDIDAATGEITKYEADND
ncbi:MAG: PepSY domain-containing protein [Clostridium sp.]|nr:PepSY domain-containing protein [Clostridium sp.]